MSEVAIGGTDSLDTRLAQSAAALMAQAFPGYDKMFRREIQAYQSYRDLFAPWFALAQDNADVLGFSLLTASLMSTDLLMITWVAVHPGNRGQGLGTKLVRLCLKEAKRRGKPVLLTTSVPVFYTKCGFRVVREYNAAQSHILMASQ